MDIDILWLELWKIYFKEYRVNEINFNIYNRMVSVSDSALIYDSLIQRISLNYFPIVIKQDALSEMYAKG